MLIGLNGHRHAGRNVAADHLVSRGFMRLAFTDPLYRILLETDPVLGKGRERLSDLVSTYGWRAVKEDKYLGAELTRKMQALGAAVREHFYEDVVIDDMVRRLNRIPARASVVIRDVNLTREAEMVRDQGGVVVRIDCPGASAFNDDPTEQALPDHLVDVSLFNDGSVGLCRALDVVSLKVAAGVNLGVSG